MCIRNNLEDDKYECIKVVKYAPRNINDINNLETFVENKNNNYNLFFLNQIQKSNQIFLKEIFMNLKLKKIK